MTLGLCMMGMACWGGDPEAAYLGGDFLVARKHYNRQTCSSLSGEQVKACNERAQQIEEALAGAALYLGRRANDRIRHSRQIQFNQYDEAIRSLELALKIMPEDHPTRPDFVIGVERIEKTRDLLQKELDDQLAKLSAMLETGTYDPEVWTDIRLTFERVRVLTIAIGKKDNRPQTLAAELVEKFRRHGQFEHARIATQLAEAVETSGRATPRHTDDELILFGIIDHMAQQQEEARKQKIKNLVNEMVAALEAKKSATAINKAHAVLDLGPDDRTARRMRAILSQLEGPAGQQKRAKEAWRVVAQTPADVQPVPFHQSKAAAANASGGASKTDDALAAAAASATATTQDALRNGGGPIAERQTIAERLRNIVNQYEKKNLYEALAELEVLYHESSGRERSKIVKLRRVWTPDRKRLTADIVKEADRLFVLMDERSLSEYRRAQNLSPDGPIADHVKERIETLQRILGG